MISPPGDHLYEGEAHSRLILPKQYHMTLTDTHRKRSLVQACDLRYIIFPDLPPFGRA
jgi:hypothetical protein